MFRKIEERVFPESAMLKALADDGHYTDCFCTGVNGRVDLETYVEAFYTTWVFKAERLILNWLASLPSTDEQARALAAGSLRSFAAWNVTERTDYQILLTDFRGRTCSWLMVATEGDGSRLYFGSAVMTAIEASAAEPIKLSRLLIGFHRLYSKILLSSARSRLNRMTEKSSY